LHDPSFVLTFPIGGWIKGGVGQAARGAKPLLVEAVLCLCKDEKPALSWLTQHAFLPVPSTP
jgi:hypothetical protein